MTIQRRDPSRRRRLAARGLMLGTLAAVLLTACDERHRLSNEMAVGLSDPELRHPIGFSARLESLDIEVPPGAEGLSQNQEIDVYRFLDRYRRESNGRVTVFVPTGVTDRASVARSLQGVQRHLTQAGIDYRIKQGTRTQRLDGAPAIRVAYERPLAVPPACDLWTENVGRNEERIPYPNFGCATQHNLAVMVDNARDLQKPQPEDPRASERRSVTWSVYVGTPAAKGGGGDGDTAKQAMTPSPKK